MARVKMEMLVAALLLAAVVTLPAVCAKPASGTAAAPAGLRLLGSTPFSNAEQVAFDDVAKVAYIIAGKELAVIDLSPTVLLGGSGSAGASLPILKVVDLGKDINDVAFCGNWLALALNGAVKTDLGSVQVHRRFSATSPASLKLLANFTVGALPDQVEFSKNCRTLLVANEGEPSGYGDPALYTDPEGSVSIIKLKASSRGSLSGTVRTANFRAFNSRRAQLLRDGVKLNGPGATVAQDLEPECATFSEDERTAFVSLQENNAIAILDVNTARIIAIHALGLKNHSAPENRLDTSDRDSGINIARWPVSGLYMPDEIKSYKFRGSNFVVSANEGDAREWPGFEEEGNVSVDNLDASVFRNAAVLANDSALGRLAIVGALNQLNDPDGDGKMERILSYGARSFSIWRMDKNRRTGGLSLSQVYDSGSLLETISVDELPTLFNSEGTTATFDRRSDNKGPEPEGVAIGPCRAGSRRRCLFMTAERLGVVFIFDITNPYKPVYQSLVMPPQLDGANEETRFRAPEGITYASYTRSKTRQFPIVLVAYEGGDGVPGGLGVYRVAA